MTISDAHRMNGTSDQTETIKLQLPASVRYLNIASAVLHALVERMPGGPPSDAISELELALQEACVNSVRHALQEKPGQHLSLGIEFEPERIVISLEDHGIAFDRESVVSPNLDEPQVHGYGLFLIEQLVDSLSYQRDGETNRWVLTKHWKGGPRDGD
jgi:serine/threonine-protein kinase RsbW